MDTTPTSHTETPKHIETRTHNQCGDKIENSQAPDDGRINVRNILSIEELDMLQPATWIPPEPATLKLQHTSKQEHTTSVVIQ